MTSTLPPDPWKALGVERDADKSEIRAAYKKLVLKCHPDKVQDPTLKAKKVDEFQKVQEAWELLNNDAEKAKYEQKLRLAELQRAAKVQQDVKNSPNTSVPRTKHATSFDIRTAEPPSRYRSSPSGGKVYSHPHYTTRSHEEMPTSRVYPLYDDTDKYARRATSYEKPRKRDEEKREREERRRRKEDEEYRSREKERDRERDKDREREREKSDKDREARKAEKKRLEREREKERHREEKNRRQQPYVESYADPADVDEAYDDDVRFVTSSRSEKKRSSSRKHDETRERDREREREKSSSRRTKSPHPSLEEKHMALFGIAASYQANIGGSLPSQTKFWQSAQQSPTPLAPTPPPIDSVDASLLHASARAAGRRASNDAARSREKLRHDIVDAIPKSRPVPTLTKSYSTPPPAPESPPRVSRSQTTPLEPHRQMPSLPRTQTWAPSTKDYYDVIESDEDRDRRHRRSRRTRSPSGQPTRYKADGTKATKLEPAYVYGESPTSTRRRATEELDGYLSNSPSSARRYVDEFDGHAAHSPPGTYAGVPFGRVKESRSYSERDVKYAKYDDPYYPSHGGDIVV